VWPSTGGLIYVAAATAGFALLGLWTFRRLEPEMAVEL
jgi:hypothetical protein